MVSQVDFSDKETVLVVNGPLYGQSETDFEKKLDELCEGAIATITLDLSRAVGFSSSLVGKLLAVHRRLLGQHRTIRIVGCNEALYSTFQMLRIDTLIAIAM